ncbi:MAG TPA: tRNA (adenosine(37)-N6)-threonylcarbamoyltransferase complex dimerization subunit type 1 TsaB [Verrucomicrobiae bacterium]|nr:tRNA (adenosine(37)-N6)-threonylcarbamoyltransferase complex dimerization subunit type 1 TsaB [Verrucomicrobiae bacterium]
MTILAFEFSSPQRSVALFQPANGGLVENEAIETGGQSTRPFEMVERVLRQACVEREQVRALAVGLGPGSYTGIRIAIALAQGWDLARIVRVSGISSVECIAEEARAHGILGLVSVVVDAQRGEFYMADYRISEARLSEAAPLRLVSKATVLEREKAGHTLVGPELRNWFESGRTVFPRAATLGKLCASRNESVSSDQLQPIYLRPTTFVKAPPPRVLPGEIRHGDSKSNYDGGAP